MYRSDQTHVAFGAALLAVGAGGVIALVLGAEQGDWCRPGFLALFAFLLLVAGVGSYALAAVYAPGLWLPPTRAERVLAPRLKVYEAAVDSIKGSDLLFHIGFINEGRGRITGAVVNVLVPENLLHIIRTDQDGHPLLIGRQSWTPEHLETDESGKPIPSIYWHDSVDFPGRVARPHYFRVRVPPSGVLSVKFDVTAEELDEAFVGRYSLDVPRETE